MPFARLHSAYLQMFGTQCTNNTTFSNWQCSDSMSLYARCPWIKGKVKLHFLLLTLSPHWLLRESGLPTCIFAGDSKNCRLNGRFYWRVFERLFCEVIGSKGPVKMMPERPWEARHCFSLWPEWDATRPQARPACRWPPAHKSTIRSSFWDSVFRPFQCGNRNSVNLWRWFTWAFSPKSRRTWKMSWQNRLRRNFFFRLKLDLDWN